MPKESRRLAEKTRRFNLTLAAYAYEIMNESIMSDAEFDAECLRVNLGIDTGNALSDAWWRENFDPSTGMWIHRHPNHELLEQMVNQKLGRV